MAPHEAEAGIVVSQCFLHPLAHQEDLSVNKLLVRQEGNMRAHILFTSGLIPRPFHVREQGLGMGPNTYVLSIILNFQFSFRNSSVSRVLYVYSIFRLASAFVTCGKFGLVEVLYCFAPY